MKAIRLIKPRRRTYQSGDKEGIYRVCLQTGDAGQDASALYKNASLLGDLYVGPYLAFQPEHAWVIEDDVGICGYVLAVKDTSCYQNWFMTEWLPEIQKNRQAPVSGVEPESPDDALLASLFDFSMYQPSWLPLFPAHFHIELLERIQGKGYGTQWMMEMLKSLQKQGCQGVHLGMHPDNKRALSFYEKLGFEVLEHADLPWEEVLYL